MLTSNIDDRQMIKANTIFAGSDTLMILYDTVISFFTQLHFFHPLTAAP